MNSNLDVCKTKPKLALYWSKYLPTIAVKGKKRKYTHGYVLSYYPHSEQGLLTHEVGVERRCEILISFSIKPFIGPLAMLKAESRVLLGEEWGSEKESAWSKNFYFIQVPKLSS